MSDVLAVRDADRLAELQARGERMKFVFFWGHREPRSGAAGPGCLSQWWSSPFTLDGVVYATAEHYMMAEKARLFGDGESAAAIVAANHPRHAKDLGRRVRGFDEAAWVEHRFEIVVRGNVAKFSQHADLGDYLRGTGRRVLVEASPLDRVWGIGLAADDERAGDVASWQGLNLLGFALMEARSRLA